jgi:hypothetical protein
MIAEGWQSVLVNNYYRETRTAHIIVFGAILFCSLVPAVVFCLGSIFIDLVGFLAAEKDVYDSIMAVHARPYGRIVALFFILAAVAAFIYASFILRKTSRETRLSVLGGKESIDGLIQEMRDMKRGIKSLDDQLREVSENTGLLTNRLNGLEDTLRRHEEAITRLSENPQI